MDKSGPKIGIFGGTFDPPHLGHLRVAEEVREAFSLEEIWFIPAGYPPHKTEAYLSFEERFHLLNLATKDNPYFKVLDVERDLKPSYTLKTLEKICSLYAQGRFYLLLGWDAFKEIDTWWNYERFLDFVELIIFSRGKGNWQEAFLLAKQRVKRLWGPKALNRVHFLEVFPIEISSSIIRNLVSQGRSIRYLVPEEVYFYFVSKTLSTPLK
ncbi:MAG: nicotinate (nicotinamide) nucleotide adenylyltransferase [Caldimicrobium sp.]|nr:nicotinate (nicotinamide) nucleotide adenylyltransferase [Caldimicrobium sp.]MCX7873213.1 nicotinate (nicotinamide) nucleotide adenylyltransferase [Caldimicrobium sp.]MDW8093900.1 nicotinate (nicotinamide) nucleotide adenylyltransferase [Caldimicrobium sp.]